MVKVDGLDTLGRTIGLAGAADDAESHQCEVAVVGNDVDRIGCRRSGGCYSASHSWGWMGFVSAHAAHNEMVTEMAAICVVLVKV